MEQNYVNVPYEEFQALSYDSALTAITKSILLNTNADYVKMDMLLQVFGIKKEA